LTFFNQFGLSHQSAPEIPETIPYKSLNEACGVFGILDRNSSGLGHTLFFGLYALQHRGQESCGMAVYDNHQLRLQKEMGLVNQVFNESILDSMTGQVGIGHTRYSTTGSSNLSNAQPVVVRSNLGALTLAHNGNLTNTAELEAFLKEKGYLGHGNSDSHVMAMYINYLLNEGSTLIQAVQGALKACKGAFSIVLATGDVLIAARDPYGLRPLCMGRNKSGALVFASETAALDIVGATFERDVKPGEIVMASIDAYYSSLQLEGRGVITSLMLEPEKPEPEEHLCVFEMVYFARPDSILNGQSVYQYRMNLGKRLAEISPKIDADIVIPVPDSGTVAAIGYSRASGIPFTEGLIKNRYVGRTFISPTHELREKGIQLKLNPLKDVLNGKKIVVVDDSIVRGNTSRNLVKMLKACGTKEVHLRISSSKVTHPCFYGIDMSSPDELIANKLSGTEAIRDFLGVDSLVYLSTKDMVDLSGYKAPCSGCFSGQYPAETPKEHLAHRVND
jgi:amidophosphoribosyltransferase